MAGARTIWAGSGKVQLASMEGCGLWPPWLPDCANAARVPTVRARVPCILATCRRQMAREANSLAVPRRPTACASPPEPTIGQGTTRSEGREVHGRARGGSEAQVEVRWPGVAFLSVSLVRDSRLPGTPANEDAGWACPTSPARLGSSVGTSLALSAPARATRSTDLAHPGYMGWPVAMCGCSASRRAHQPNSGRAVAVAANAFTILLTVGPRLSTCNSHLHRSPPPGSPWDRACGALARVLPTPGREGGSRAVALSGSPRSSLA